MSTIVITNPAHDETTKVLSAWIDAVAKYIENGAQHTVVGLNDHEANKQSLNEAYDAHGPGLIMINGHGNPDVLCGHNNLPLIESSDPENERYGDVIIHALACAAAKNLGVELVEGGLSAFIGYNENFHFYHDTKEGSDPLKDPLAALFLEPAYHIPKALADGHSAREAYDQAQRMYKDNFLLAHKSNVDQPVLASLYHDIKNHVVLGSATASL